MMRTFPRSLDAELLDAPDPDPVEVRQNLAEMAMLNRLPGGVRSSVPAVLDLAGSEPAATVLDVGTGSGDFARHLRNRSAAPIILIDINDVVREVATRNVAGMDDVTVMAGDARALPLADGAVGVAHASLLLHHLDPDEAVAALREMRRVARRGVVVNDLRRSRLAFAMTAIGVLALARGRYTRHDGLLSARRAYTLDELDKLAADAGLRPVARTAPWWPRVTTTYQ